MTDTLRTNEMLADYLEQVCGPFKKLDISPVVGGQSNPTFFVTAGQSRLVLRKQPEGEILRGAHAIDREFQVLSGLFPTSAPVPRPVAFCNDATILGTPFYLMERVDGRIFTDAALPDLPKNERRAMWMGVADAMALMHAVRPEAVGLEDFGRPGDYFQRQITRWTRQLLNSPSAPNPDLDAISEWLRLNQPEDDGATSLAHGDFRLGNLIFHPTEPRVVAILDWELSTLGHPLADLGFCCMAWHSAPDEYGGMAGLDLDSLNLPHEAEFVARYQCNALHKAPLLKFHKVFALFRFAVIFVGIADRVRAGSAAGSNAAQLAPLAGKFTLRAQELIEDRPHCT